MRCWADLQVTYGRLLAGRLIQLSGYELLGYLSAGSIARPNSCLESGPKQLKG